MEKNTEDIVIVGGIFLVVVVLFVLNHAAPTKTAPITLVPSSDVTAAVSQSQAAAAQANANVANQNAAAAGAGSNASLLAGLASLGSAVGGAINGNNYGADTTGN